MLVYQRVILALFVASGILLERLQRRFTSRPSLLQWFHPSLDDRSTIQLISVFFSHQNINPESGFLNHQHILNLIFCDVPRRPWSHGRVQPRMKSLVPFRLFHGGLIWFNGI